MAEPDVDQEEVPRVRGGKYDGPEAHVIAPWKCPACGVDQVGRVELGCPSCGSGKPGTHVGVQQAPRKPSPTPAETNAAAATMGLEKAVEYALMAWVEQQGARWRTSSMDVRGFAADAFRAGWQAAQGQTMQAPPVTADLTRLSPEGKTSRTIIAALEMFVDGVLRGNPEEILSGEWCSVEEAQALIAQLRPGAEI